MKRARFSEEQIIGILKAAEAAGNKTRLFRSSGLRAGLLPSLSWCATTTEQQQNADS
jgi:hypothetical protein